MKKSEIIDRLWGVFESTDDWVYNLENNLRLCKDRINDLKMRNLGRGTYLPALLKDVLVDFEKSRKIIEGLREIKERVESLTGCNDD